MRISYSSATATLALVVAVGSGGAVFADELLPKDSVGTAQIRAGAVSTRDLSNDAVRAGKVANGTLTGADVRNGTLTGADMRDRSVNTSDLGKDAVRAGKVANGTLTRADIRNGSLTGSDMRDESVTGADISEATLDPVPTARQAAHADQALRATVSNQAGHAAVADRASNVIRLAVSEDGELVSSLSSPGVDVIPVAEGRYHVDLGRDPRSCASTASLGNAVGRAEIGAISVFFDRDFPQFVTVRTFDTDFAEFAKSFTLIAVC
jgi:hypothetical protein